MKTLKTLIVASTVTAAVLGGLAFSDSFAGEREAVEFYSGHWHDEHGTHYAPQHSGGTDSAGCHNGSVPYHCH